MNRGERRRVQKELEKLSPDTIKAIETYCRKEAEEKLDLYKKLVDDAVFNAMRMNRVGEERAYRIIGQANELMLEEVRHQEKKVN